jgi:recombinational DNA repair protein (RecF pathway)
MTGSYNGLTRAQFDYIERETQFEVCSACTRKIYPGTYRERREGKIVCFDCIQKLRKSAAPAPVQAKDLKPTPSRPAARGNR